LEQVTAWLFGFVIDQVTAPLGCTAPDTPVTVVVRVEVPPKIGLEDEARVMVGSCCANVAFKVLLEAVAKLASPAKLAVAIYVPACGVEIVQV
jgi:hypothetical protein